MSKTKLSLLVVSILGLISSVVLFSLSMWYSDSVAKNQIVQTIFSNDMRLIWRNVRSTIAPPSSCPRGPERLSSSLSFPTSTTKKRLKKEHELRR
jgi:hypothetical protein